MKEWLNRAQFSLSEALSAKERGDIPLENLYMLAPLVYSKIQHMNDDVLLQEMMAAIDKRVKYDWSIDEDSKNQYRFHYVSSYLYCFVVAGKIDEMKYDRIMEYVNSGMELFSENYGA